MKGYVLKRLIVAAALLVFVLGSVSFSIAGQAAPNWAAMTPSVSVPWVYAGPSSGTAGGGAGMPGLAAMNALCRSTYGEQAKMCTTDEIFLSPRQPSTTSTSGFQWVNLSFQNCVMVTAPVTEYNGTTVAAPSIQCWVNGAFSLVSLDPTEYSCAGWTSVTGDGAVTYGPPYGWGYAPCANAFPVACCAPPQSTTQW
jgi:hypothetical protein